MKLFDRLEHVRVMVETSGIGRYDRYPGAIIQTNGFLLADAYDAKRAKSDGQGALQHQQAQMRQGQADWPKGKWVATVAQFMADDDDPEQAVMKLEKKVASTVSAYLDEMITERTQKLIEAKALAEQVRSALTGSPDRGGSP